MSGGYFEFNQYRIDNIVDEIQHLIDTNEDGTVDKYGDRKGKFYPPEVIDKFKEAIKYLQISGKMVHRIDYLVCDDDGIETFLKEWKEECE